MDNPIGTRNKLVKNLNKFIKSGNEYHQLKHRLLKSTQYNTNIEYEPLFDSDEIDKAKATLVLLNETI